MIFSSKCPAVCCKIVWQSIMDAVEPIFEAIKCDEVKEAALLRPSNFHKKEVKREIRGRIGKY